MRPHSQELQHSIRQKPRKPTTSSHRILAAILLSLVTVLLTPPAYAGTEVIEGQGRRIQTGPKGIQAAVDGIPLVEEQTAPTASGYSMAEKGRLLSARPAEPVSVGLLGCPGCRWMLEAVGGVFINVDRRGPYRQPRGGVVDERKSRNGGSGKKLGR